MKNWTTILMIIATTGTSMAQQSSMAITTKKTFSRTTSVSVVIDADAAIIWTLLTNAADYPRWNSTIISLEGDIAPGGKIRLKSTLDPKRTFKLKIKEFAVENQLSWGDGKGNRVFTLSQENNGVVTFHMTEKIGGVMFPLYARYIPSFDQSFDQFAADLKKEAELIMSTK